MGLLIWEISRGNAYGIVVLVCFADLFSAYFILCTPAHGVGTVFAVTFSIIAFIPYLGGPYHNIVDLAWNRGYMIVLGILGSLLMNLIIWPYNARSKLGDEIACGTMELQTLYLSLSRQMMSGGLAPSKESAQEFERLEQQLQSRFARSRSLIGLLSAEISLIPKPFQYFTEILSHLQDMADHLLVLRLCREHGMRAIRREAILNVLDLRKDFVSRRVILIESKM
jgi:Aluminium activated malate transporter